MRSELALLASLLCSLLPVPTSAEDVLSVYGGVQGPLPSHISDRDTDGSHLGFDADWAGSPSTCRPTPACATPGGCQTTGDGRSTSGTPRSLPTRRPLRARASSA